MAKETLNLRVSLGQYMRKEIIKLTDINHFLCYEFPKYQLIHLNSNEWNDNPSNILFNYLELEEFKKRGNNLFEKVSVRYGVVTDNNSPQFDKKKSVSLNVYPLEIKKEKTVEYYEKIYQQSLLSTAQIKQELINRLLFSRNKLSESISSNETKLTLINQNIKIHEKNKEYLNNQKEYMEEIETKEKQALIGINHQIILQQQEIACLIKEIERISNIFLMKKQQTKQLDQPNTFAPLINEITELQTMLDKNKTLLQTKQLNMSFLKQKKETLQTILMQGNNGLQQEMSYVLERADYFNQKVVSYRIKQSVVSEKLAELVQQKEKLNNRLIELGESPYALIDNVLFDQMYFFGFSDLSITLTKERGEAISMCNYINQEKQPVGILTTKFNPEIDAIIQQYKVRGWLQQKITHHNLYQDLLQLNKIAKLNRTVQKTDMPDVEIVELKDNSGKMIMNSFFKNGELFKKDYYNNKEECVLIYQFKKQKLIDISYKDQIFKNEQELISFWLNHYVAPKKMVRVIVHQETPMLNEQLVLNENGISLVPMIYDSKNLDQLMLNQSIDELFLADESDLDSISNKLTREVCIRQQVKLVDKEVEEPLKTRIMIGE